MAIAPTGTKQKTYYVREDLARVIAMIASRDGRRESDVVTEALKAYVEDALTTEELRVFGFCEVAAVESGSPPGIKRVAAKR